MTSGNHTTANIARGFCGSPAAVEIFLGLLHFPKFKMIPYFVLGGALFFLRRDGTAVTYGFVILAD